MKVRAQESSSQQTHTGLTSILRLLMQARSYEADRFVWLILITYEVKNPNLKQADILN